MSRHKAPMPSAPTGDAAWPILNARLFGSQQAGGFHVAPRPEVLPFDWTPVFGREAPRTLEIGFNRGRFLRSLAEAWPGHDHLGIEVRRRYAWLVAQEMTAAGGPRNAAVIWGDAKLLVPGLFGPESLAAVFINFPDPWWKRRHEKRRLVDPDFAARLAASLVPGGRIWVKSDAEVIATDIEQVLREEPRLAGPTPFAQDVLPPTWRERRCLAQGLPITRFWFERRA